MNKKLPFSSFTKEKVTKVINELGIDDIIKSYLMNFLMEEDVIAENAKSYNFNQSLFGFLEVIDGRIESVKDFTWKTYCLQMHELNNVRSKCKRERVLRLPKIILSHFYKYMYDKNTSVYENLSDCIHLMLPYEFQIPKSLSSFRDIISNFYIGSNPQQILQFAFDAEKSVNVDIKADKDTFVYNVLQGFVDKIIHNGFVKGDRSSLRIFLFSFLESLGDEEESNLDIYSFNFESFKRQIFFYEQIDFKYKFTSINTKRIIKNFYIYLDDAYFQKQGKRLFTDLIFNRDLISTETYHRHILNSFRPCIRAPQDEVPHFDKWLLINHQDGSSPTYKDRLITVDFSKVDEQFRKVLKEYLWGRNFVNINLSMEFATIEEFLRNYLEYQKDNNKVIFLNAVEDSFPIEFLLNYKAKVVKRVLSDGKIVNSRTASAQLNRIRAYLIFVKDKYDIPDANIQLFNGLKRDYKGGKPLTENELKVISEFILSDESEENAKLYHYIFYLMCNTKLRLGEILNLERDCIVYKDEKLGFGEIMYLSKTSNYEKTKEIFLIEDIKVIENAIKLTSPLLMYASEKYKSYIFLATNKSRFSTSVKNVGVRFRNYFDEVIKIIYKEGRIQREYSVNNLRHTYIDMSWQAVEDNIITSMEVGFVTGNSAEVATKHYREYQTKRYLEATHMVTIGNVNIDGEIEATEEALVNMQPVKNGEGACKSSTCIKTYDDDSDLECLTCKKFVTSVQRSELFQQRLEHYNRKAKTTEEEQEKVYYKTLAELYASYLAEMYKIMEKRD